MRLHSLVALLYLLTCITGCLAPITTGGIGMAAGGAPVAFNYIGGRKTESFWFVKYNKVIEATQQSAEALSLEIENQTIDQDQAIFRLSNGKEKIDIFIEPRSDTIMFIKFDVGWFGSVAFARFVVRQIIDELHETDSFLENWANDELGFGEPLNTVKPDN
jgi:hypothetical protein